MTNINTELRQAYYALLNGNVLLNSTAVPVYFGQAPMGTQPDSYILIQGISNNPAGNTDEFNITNTSIILYVVTKRYLNNSGLDCEDITGQIYQLVLPSPRGQTVQTASGFVANTTNGGDQEITGLTDGQKQIINRVIQFNHTIQQ